MYPLEDGPAGDEIVMEVGTASVIELDNPAELASGTTYPLENEPIEATPEDVGT